jgi:hypothetical protein
MRTGRTGLPGDPAVGSGRLGSAPRKARRRARDRKRGGSISAGTVDDQAGELRQDDAPAAGQVAAAEAPAAARTAEPEAPTPVAAEPTFDSGEESAYPLDAQIEVPDIGKIAGDEGTVSLWLQPQWDVGNQDDATLMQLGDQLQLTKNVNYLRLELMGQDGVGGLGVPITEWQQGEWHQVTATWNGNAMALYVDGQLVSQTINGQPIELPEEAKLYIGSDYPLNRPVAPGTIGRIDVRGRPLSPAEIAAAYKTAIGR